MPEASDITGVLLIGGASRRFGTPKQDIRVSGETLLERASGVLQQVLQSPPLIVGGPSLPDLRPDHGPLAGIETAFEHCTTEWLLVLACDMPAVTPKLLSLLAFRECTAQVLLPESGDRRHSLCARWHRSALVPITQALSSGALSVRGLLAKLEVVTLSEEDMRRHGVDPSRELYNVNRPEDLERFVDGGTE